MESDTNNNEKLQKTTATTTKQSRKRKNVVEPQAASGQASDVELFDDNNGKFYIFYSFFFQVLFSTDEGFGMKKTTI